MGGSKSYYHHKEKALIGYRWYHAQQREVSYPFGFGLFAYGRSAIEYSGAKSEAGADNMIVTCSLRNTGEFSGHDVPQLYLKFPSSVPGDANSKPEWVLKGFEKVSVSAGVAVDVEFPLTIRDLSYWDDAPGKSMWICATGEFTACVGANARDAILPDQGSCVTFQSPCTAESPAAGSPEGPDVIVKASVGPAIEIKAALFDADGQLKRDQEISVGPPAFLIGVVAFALVGATGLTLWRFRGSWFEGSNQLSDTAWQLLGLEEQPLTREDSCVE